MSDFHLDWQHGSLLVLAIILGVASGILTGATGDGLPLEGQQWWVAPVVGGIAGVAALLRKGAGDNGA